VLDLDGGVNSSCRRGLFERPSKFLATAINVLATKEFEFCRVDMTMTPKAFLTVMLLILASGQSWAQVNAECRKIADQTLAGQGMGSFEHPALGVDKSSKGETFTFSHIHPFFTLGGPVPGTTSVTVSPQRITISSGPGIGIGAGSSFEMIELDGECKVKTAGISFLGGIEPSGVQVDRLKCSLLGSNIGLTPNPGLSVVLCQRYFGDSQAAPGSPGKIHSEESQPVEQQKPGAIR
jgi:hypothetical protein